MKKQAFNIQHVPGRRHPLTYSEKDEVLEAFDAIYQHLYEQDIRELLERKGTLQCEGDGDQGYGEPLDGRWVQKTRADWGPYGPTPAELARLMALQEKREKMAAAADKAYRKWLRRRREHAT